MTTLLFPDALSLADLHSYAVRARALDPDAAIRLYAQGTVLAAYVGVLPGRGLTGSGAVLGLRTLALARPASIDVTVAVGAVLDRLARGPAEELSVPPASVFVAWAGISPPRSGWTDAGDFPAAELVDVARAGIAEVAAAGTGLSAQVDALRGRVWAAPLPGTRHDDSPGAPAGLAFAAYGLGFLAADGRASLRRTGTWWRLSTPAGHVLSR